MTPMSPSGFHDAMRSFKATYLWHDMRWPYYQTKAILLPRDQARSMRVARALREVGIFDLGAYLADLCQRQKLGMAA